MSKIGVAVCGNSGLDYLAYDKEIRIFRSHLIIEKVEYEDFVDITSDDFYGRLSKNPELAIHTTQTSTGYIMEMYEEMKAAGYEELVIITVSKHLSGTFQNAVLAAKMVDMKVHVFDSLSVSYVEAFMAISAKKMADQGNSVDEIMNELEFIRDHNHILITVDTLKYLIKNGRLSKSAGALGSLLKLRPLLEVSKEGKVETLAKIRTTSKARNEMKNVFVEDTKGKEVLSFIIYTNNQEEMLDFKEEFENKGYVDMKLIPLTPVVGCHAGPGTMGMGYIEKRR